MIEPYWFSLTTRERLLVANEVLAESPLEMLSLDEPTLFEVIDSMTEC